MRVKSAWPAGSTLIKNKIKFSSNIKKYKWERLQSVGATLYDYVQYTHSLSLYLTSPHLMGREITCPHLLNTYSNTVKYRGVERNMLQLAVLWAVSVKTEEYLSSTDNIKIILG
jgi:hypothetical protein